MSSSPTRVGLIIALAMAATWQAAAAAGPIRPLKITFSDTPAGSSVECAAEMSMGDKKAARLKHKHTIAWSLDGTNCKTFDATKVGIVFYDKVMKNGMTFYGAPMPGNSHLGTITEEVTDVPGDAPPKSRHMYVITYNGKNAGDPELDIDNNPAPGPGGPPPPSTPTRGTPPPGSRGGTPPPPGGSGRR